MKTKDIVSSVVSIVIKVVVIVIAAMFIYKYATIAYDYGYRIFGEEPMSSGDGRTVTVTVGSDMSTKEIGEMLENKGLIRDATLFVLQEKFSEYSGQIKAGIYDLNTSMTADEMIAVMAGTNDESSTEESNPIEDAKSEAEEENAQAEEAASEDTEAEATAAEGTEQVE